jgi:hypothetical protein
VTMLPETMLPGLLDPLQARALGGACVQIVTNADTVHVLPGASVAIVAHLTDTDGIATFAGPITAHNGAGRVTPPTAQANLNATFTYSAPGTAQAGDTDTVQLSHISHRGKARDGTVKVIVDSANQRFQVTALSESLHITSGASNYANFNKSQVDPQPVITTACDATGPCLVSVKGGFNLVYDGYVEGPSCTHTYPSETHGPNATQQLFMTIDRDAHTVSATTGYRALEVGDISSDACGADTQGRSPEFPAQTVSYDQLMSGQPVTFSFSGSGTAPASSHSLNGSSTLGYTFSQSVTLHRLLP